MAKGCGASNPIAVLLAVVMVNAHYDLPGDRLTFVSASGDPGLLSDYPAVLTVGWNFCNEALAPAAFPTHPSPRWADCVAPDGSSAHTVTAANNALGPGDPFPLPGYNATVDVNVYALTKELVLGALCSRAPENGGAAGGSSPPGNWSYNTIMFKTGNMGIDQKVCPITGPRWASDAAAADSLRFNNLPMNQPVVALTPATMQAVPYGGTGYVGSVGGTYDVNANWTTAEITAVQRALADYTAAWVSYRFSEVDGTTPLPPSPDSAPPALLVNKSYVGTIWWKNASSGSTVFSHIQSTSPSSPWLMNYFKLMDTQGVGGGYDWNGMGQMYGPVPSYATKVRVQYKQLASSKGSFGGLYVPCHGGCWKLNGQPCDGDLDSDITRYICFVTDGSQGCTAKNQGACPPFHVRSSDYARVYPNQTDAFPYECYAGHCPPGGCDPYSNPGPQELMMLLPCAEWAEHGYPAVQGGGQGEVLELDVGAIGARVALSGAEPADIGPVARAARGWVSLPSITTLPPFPGWTRSWVGFDFGVEQPSPGTERYEFTAVDVLVAQQS